MKQNREEQGREEKDGGREINQISGTYNGIGKEKRRKRGNEG